MRYCGGARRPGAVTELVDAWNAAGLGICQLPCPEQRAWGGVAKRRLLPAYGAAGSWRYRLRRPLVALFRLRTRISYRRLAEEVADQVVDYRSAGMHVHGMVGVAGSPSCGVHTTLDLAAAVDALAELDPKTVSGADVNRVVLAAACPGRGLFVDALERALLRRDVRVEWAEQDLSVLSQPEVARASR